MSWDVSNSVEIDHDDQFSVKIVGHHENQLTTFKDPRLDLHEKLIENIGILGLKDPTPVQSYGIPQIAAKLDLMCCSCTGSGKTAAFLLPILNNILKDGNNTCGTIDGESGANGEGGGRLPEMSCPRALVLVPTRELAEQIRDDAIKFAKGLPVSTLAVFGGDRIGFELKKLKLDKIDVLVATPGRLAHLLQDFSVISLEHVEYLVIDEADEMHSKDFFPQINLIIDQIQPKQQRVTAMFSATFPNQIQYYAKKHLRPGFVFVVVGIIGGASPNVIQEIVPASEVEKEIKLRELIERESEKKLLVFCNTIEKVDFLVKSLSVSKVKNGFIHSEISQEERDQAILDFNEGRINILVATSVAARGLNIHEISLVVNYDLPKDINEYIQRIGRARTNSFGELGYAISFYDAAKDEELNSDLIFALKSANQSIPEFLMDVENTKAVCYEEEDIYCENEDLMNKMKKFKIASCPFEMSEDDWWG